MTDILTEAHGLINGNRQAAYGHPLDNFTRIADLINVTFSHKIADKFTAQDVALMMIQLKVARQIGNPKRDNMVDIAGYAGCSELIELERERRAKVELDSDDVRELELLTKQSVR